MNEQYSLEFQLSFLKKLHQCSLVNETSRPAAAPPESAAQPTLREPSGPESEERPAKIGREEKESIYQLSRIIEKKGDAIRKLMCEVMVRQNATALMEELDLIWNTFASPGDKFDFYLNTLKVAFKQLQPPDYARLEAEMLAMIARKTEESGEYPPEIDDFLLKLVNPAVAVRFAYRAAKADTGSTAIAALALSGLSSSEEALKLAVKTGKPAVLKELKVLLDEKWPLVELFTQEAQRQFAKLLPANPKSSGYTREKVKRLFSPLLVLIPSRPKHLQQLIAQFDQLLPPAAEALREKLEMLFLVMKVPKLEEAVAQILHILQADAPNPRINDLLYVIMQTREKRPQIYGFFVGKLRAMYAREKTGFLGLAQRLDLSIVIDLLLAQHEEAGRFDAAVVSEVLQSAGVSPTAFLCGLAYRAPPKSKLDDYCAFISNFMYFYASQLNAQDFAQFIVESSEREFPMFAFFIALLFAEEEKRRARSVEAFVPFFRKAVSRVNYDNEEVWEWTFKLYALDQVVFKENIAVEFPEKRRGEFFSRLSQQKRA